MRVLLHSARALFGTCFMVGMLVPSASSHEGRSTPTPTPWLAGGPPPWALPGLVACPEGALEAVMEVLMAGLGPLDSGPPDQPGVEP